MLIIGKALKAHGVRGFIKAKCFMDTPECMLPIKSIFIDNISYDVERTALNGSFVLLKLKGIDSMEQAEALRDKDISANKIDLPVLPDGTFYIDEIIGCMVVCGDSEYGIVEDILQYGSADVYILRKGEKTISFPLVSGVVEKTDVVRKKIFVNEVSFNQVAVYED